MDTTTQTQKPTSALSAIKSKYGNTTKSKKLESEIPLPDWLLIEKSLEPEKTKVVLFLKKGETISGAFYILGQKLGRMPTDQELFTYLQ